MAVDDPLDGRQAGSASRLAGRVRPLKGLNSLSAYCILKPAPLAGRSTSGWPSSIARPNSMRAGVRWLVNFQAFPSRFSFCRAAVAVPQGGGHRRRLDLPLTLALAQLGRHQRSQRTQGPRARGAARRASPAGVSVLRSAPACAGSPRTRAAGNCVPDRRADRRSV